jgi:adenosylcobyric acid synthase
MGTYCHGLLESGGLRSALLARIGAQGSGREHAGMIDAALDELAAELERHLDIDGLLALARRTRA